MSVNPTTQVEELRLALTKLISALTKLEQIHSRHRQRHQKPPDGVYLEDLIDELESFNISEQDVHDTVWSMSIAMDASSEAYAKAVGIGVLLKFGMDQPGQFETRLRSDLADLIDLLDDAVQRQPTITDLASIRRMFDSICRTLEHTALDTGLPLGQPLVPITEPTMRDLASEAGISDDTFRRVRDAAQISVNLKGGAARNRRYTPNEVDRLIAAALAGNFIERRAIAEKWAQFASK